MTDNDSHLDAHETAAGDEELTAFASKLFDFARAGDTTLVEYVDNGLNPNLVNQDGHSLVMMAAYHGHADLVRELAQRGADVDQLNDRAQSPLAGAVFKKEDDVIDALLAAGADPHAGQPSAIDTATMFERTDLVARFRRGEEADDNDSGADK